MNRNLKRSLIKSGFSLLMVLYNSTQSALNLLTYIEEVEDFDNIPRKKFHSHYIRTLVVFSVDFRFFFIELALDNIQTKGQ